jgi:hypothetical protein
MSKQENNEEMPEEILTYVYVPDENLYGIIKSYGSWSSLIEYYDNGIGYVTEIPNDEFIVINEIGIGYIDEMDENL